MISTKEFKKLETRVRKSRMAPRFHKGKYVARIHAPAIVVEMIVKKASLASGIPMDWHYVAGYGIVYTLGHVAASRKALELVLPVHYLD